MIHEHPTDEIACETCKYRDVLEVEEPCASCAHSYECNWEKRRDDQ